MNRRKLYAVVICTLGRGQEAFARGACLAHRRRNELAVWSNRLDQRRCLRLLGRSGVLAKAVDAGCRSASTPRTATRPIFRGAEEVCDPRPPSIARSEPRHLFTSVQRAARRHRSSSNALQRIAEASCGWSPGRRPHGLASRQHETRNGSFGLAAAVAQREPDAPSMRSPTRGSLCSTSQRQIGPVP